MASKTNTVAVVTAFVNSFSFFEVYLLNGFEKQNLDMGKRYKLNQYSTGGSIQRKKDFLRALTTDRIADGVISMFLHFDEEDMKALNGANIPVVFVDEEMEGAHSVKSDNFKGAFMATEYLIKKGRKDIGFVMGQMKNEGTGITPLERLHGYKSALNQYGIAYDEKRVVEIINYSFEEGEKAFAELVSRSVKLDSVFSSAGDMVGLGVMDEAQRQKMDVPKDLAIIGYDDINMAALSKPPLTTVKQPIELMGREAFRLVVDAIEEKLSKPQKIIHAPELVIRGSA